MLGGVCCRRTPVPLRDRAAFAAHPLLRSAVRCLERAHEENDCRTAAQPPVSDQCLWNTSSAKGRKDGLRSSSNGLRGSNILSALDLLSGSPSRN
eukprot:2014427-Prorocentrum_lima.AAC.1